MPFQLADVEHEYAKDKDLKREDIKMLSEWMKKQPHLPEITELQLIMFLHSCYYRLEAAKVAIDNFFTVRTLCPELYGTPSVEVIKRELSVGSVNVLPKRSPEGYAVVMTKLIDCNPDHYRCNDQINLLDLVMMLNLHQQGTCNGITVIFDMQGLTFGHLTRFNMVSIKKNLFYVQEATPIRIKQVHHINIVPFTDVLVGMSKPFLKKELVDLLKFHSTLETLYKYVPKEILPKEYGGEAPSLATLHEQNTKNILDNVDLFKWLNTQKVDESKRPGKPKNTSEIFGVDGTFKKLEVD